MGDDLLAGFSDLCSGAVLKSEGGADFVYLPGLKVPVGANVEVRDALLSLKAHSGYASRLYLSSPISGRGDNWTTHTVLGRAWHTPSWRDVSTPCAIALAVNRCPRS